MEALRSGQANAMPSCIVAIDKPQGLTSHDVVNRVRKIFNVRRVGHCGTLDPMATGVLLVCVGPAARLSNYLIDKDKRYSARIVFGAATDTDDGEGGVLSVAAVDPKLADPAFARQTLERLRGVHTQVPPAYSAIKREGKRAYAEARAGRAIELPARRIEIYDARLIALGIEEHFLEDDEVNGRSPLGLWERTYLPDEIAQREDLIWWDVDLMVSKGTYIRSIARDLGRQLESSAFLGALRRTKTSACGLEECVSLDALGDLRERAALDPIPLLGLRYTFADSMQARAIAQGRALAAKDVTLYEGFGDPGRRNASCVPALRESLHAPEAGENVAAIAEDRVVAVLTYEEQRRAFQPRCVLTTGAIRGRAV